CAMALVSADVCCWNCAMAVSSALNWRVSWSCLACKRRLPSAICRFSDVVTAGEEAVAAEQVGQVVVQRHAHAAAAHARGEGVLAHRQRAACGKRQPR